MHISFLLSQIFTNNTIKKNITKNNAANMPVNTPLKHNIPQNTVERTVKHSVAEKSFTAKTDNKISGDFPMIYDSVEISEKAADFEALSATGYADPAGAGYSADSGKCSVGQRDDGKKSQFDIFPAVIALIGCILIILSLFFLPKSLPLTIAGILLVFFGFLKSLN